MQTLLRISTTFKAPYIDVDTSQLVDMDLCNYTMSLPLSDRLKGESGRAFTQISGYSPNASSPETLDVLSMFCECIADEATSDASSLGDIESQSSEPDRFSTSLLPSKPSADDLQYQRYLKQPSRYISSVSHVVDVPEQLPHLAACFKAPSAQSTATTASGAERCVRSCMTLPMTLI